MYIFPSWRLDRPTQRSADRTTERENGKECGREPGVSILMGILVTVTISTLLLTHGYGVFSLFSQNAEVIELGIRIAPGNLSLLFYICISGGFFRSAAGNGKNNGADGGYPCKYVRNPYAESLVPDAALSQRGRSGRNLSDHLDNYGLSAWA